MKKAGLLLAGYLVYCLFSLPHERAERLDEPLSPQRNVADRQQKVDSPDVHLSPNDPRLEQASPQTGVVFHRNAARTKHADDMMLTEKEIYHRRFVARNPTSPRALRDYADFLIEGARYAQALSLLREGLALDPKPEWVAYQKQIESFVEQRENVNGPIGPAIPPLQPLLLLEPGESQLTPEQAREADKRIESERKTLREKYQRELGVPRYEKGEDESLALQVALDYFYAGFNDEAVTQFERLQREYPSSPEVLSNYIYCLVREERFEEAIRAVREGRRKFSDDARLHVIEDVLVNSALENFKLATTINFRLSILGLDD